MDSRGKINPDSIMLGSSTNTPICMACICVLEQLEIKTPSDSDAVINSDDRTYSKVMLPRTGTLKTIMPANSAIVICA